MKSIAQKFFFLILIFWFLSCSQNTTNKSQATANTIEDSPCFAIANLSNFRIISVLKPGNRKDTLAKYVLFHRGSKKPNLNFPATYVETPVKNVVCLSTIFVGCMEKIGEIKKIIAVDNLDYIYNNEIKARGIKGEVKEVAIGGSVNIEKTISLKPDLIFAYGTSNGMDDSFKKISEFGIPTVFSMEQFESTPLARAAWLKFVAAFFEKDEIADSVFNLCKTRYDSLKFLIKNISNRPKVISELHYNNTWHLPGGKSFAATLFKDAGANYFLCEDKNSGSLPMSFESVFMKAKDVDFWINVHSWNKLADAEKHDKRNSEFTAVKTGNVFNNTNLKLEDGANAYWETGFLSPDELLKDLIRIFHPLLLPNHKLKYYKKLL